VTPRRSRESIARWSRGSGARTALRERASAPRVRATLAALRDAARAGDRARFDFLFERAFARVYAWAWRRSAGEVDRAERLTESVFSAVLEPLDPET